MTEEQRAELEKLARAAAPGPYSIHRTGERHGRRPYGLGANDGKNIINWGGVSSPATQRAEDTLQFIEAANPATVIDLLATIARLEAEKVKDGEAWMALTPDEQFALATRIAANVGYELTPEPEHPDSPHTTPEGQTEGAVVSEAIKHLRAMSHVAPRSFEVEAAFDFLARHDAANGATS